MKAMHLIPILLLAALPAAAAPTCSDLSGESMVIAGDLASARAEAVNRAKLAAIEQIAGVDVRSRTIVENGALLDDIVTTQLRGALTGYRLLGESRQGDTLSVRINACVEPASARSAVSALAMNTAISVFIPAQRPTSGSKNRDYDEDNLFAQQLLGRLAEQGFKVQDIAESHALKLNDIAAAFKGGDQPALRSIIYRYLTNSILIGRIDTTLSNARGENVGHGISMPFNKVTARLSYRLMARGGDGRMSVVAAGAEEAGGLGPSIEDAYAAALKNLAAAFTPLILGKIQARLDQIGTRIQVTVAGLTDPAETLALRESLQQITWVSAVESTAPGQFLVSYPENPLYLANSLSRNGFRITRFTRSAITVTR